MRKVRAVLAVMFALSGCGQEGTAESEAATAQLPAPRTPRRKVDPRTPVQESSPTPVPDVDELPAEEAPLLQAEIIEPDRPRPPSDYGLIQPTNGLPETETLTHNALAGYEVVAIYDKPDSASQKLGYIRYGSRTKVTAKVEGKGCSKSWYELPQGGYACSGRGLVVDKKREPFMKAEPAPARMDQSFPYDYGFVKTWNTPSWWRIPTAAEQAAAQKRRRDLEAKRKGEPLPEPTPPPVTPAPAAAPKPEAKPTPKAPPKPEVQAKAAVPDIKALPGPDGKAVLASTEAKPPEPAKAEPAKPEVAKAEPKPEPVNAEPAKAEPVPAPEPEPEIDLPLNAETPFLERGFFVSLDATVEDDSGKKWLRTSRGAYIESSAVYKYNVNDFEGAVLDVGADFPFGYVMNPKGSKLLELGDEGNLKVISTLEHRTFVDLQDETEIGGTTYMVTTEGQLIKKGHIRQAVPQAMPEGLQEWDRWIDVSLSKQMLVAYEGTRPVFVTLVSTGKKGTKEEPFDTPTGRWRIQSKRVSTTMDGAPDDGTFSIEDVPWTMYFEGNYALHGAFWHEGFGRVRSHGCVNLGPSSARWLFFWTTPYLPQGWHGVQAHDGSPGTTVVIHK